MTAAGLEPATSPSSEDNRPSVVPRENGAAGGFRPHDLRVFSAALYYLSYYGTNLISHFSSLDGFLATEGPGCTEHFMGPGLQSPNKPESTASRRTGRNLSHATNGMSRRM